jgi:hypothetical protein
MLRNFCFQEGMFKEAVYLIWWVCLIGILSTNRSH